MNYKSFYRIFLSEMPHMVSGGNSFDAHLEMICELISDGSDTPTQVANNVFKLENGSQTTYWHGNIDATSVSIIVDTEQEGNFLRVVLCSKNPTVHGTNGPYASEIYEIIKNDIGTKGLVFSGDTLMSVDAIKLWKGMVRRGHTVSVYDTNTHQYVLSPVLSDTDLDSYIGNASNSNFIFVLSEDLKYQQGLIHSVNIMEIKRLAGYPLFESISASK